MTRQSPEPGAEQWVSCGLHGHGHLHQDLQGGILRHRTHGDNPTSGVSATHLGQTREHQLRATCCEMTRKVSFLRVFSYPELTTGE